MELSVCKVCGEELVGGTYEKFGFCPVCGDILDDIIAKYLELVAKKCSEKEFDEITYEVILRYLDEIVDWVEYFEELDEYSSDQKYYERFRMVLNWLEDRRNKFEDVVTKKFKKCEACGADFSRNCIQIERDGDWIRVYCGSCGFLISKHYSPKVEL
jgi:hypothetical protein